MSNPETTNLTEAASPTEPRNYYSLADIHIYDTDKGMYTDMLMVNELSMMLCSEYGVASYNDLPPAVKSMVIELADQTVEQRKVAHHD